MIIDIGANVGEFILDCAKAYPSGKFIAVEPIRENIAIIANLKSQRNLEDLIILEGVVSDKSEIVDFNVSLSGDKGVSSVLDFNPDLARNEYWSTRDDLNFSHSLKVQSKPMSEWLEGFGDEDIEFVKIDCQGLDLIALKSFGPDWIKRINAGMLECAGSDLDFLYSDETCDMTHALATLASFGFKVYKILPNDLGYAEYNIYFYREIDQFLGIMDKFLLASNPVFLGGMDASHIMAQYENSYSWKVTKPLRTLKRLISKRLSKL